MYNIPATKAWIWLNPADRCETFCVKRQRSGAAPISLRMSRRKTTLGMSDFAVLGSSDTSDSWISLMHVWQPRYGVGLRSYFNTYLKNLSLGLNQIYRTHTAHMHASTNTHSQLNDRYKDARGQVQSVLSNSHVWSFFSLVNGKFYLDNLTRLPRKQRDWFHTTVQRWLCTFGPYWPKMQCTAM